MAHRGIPIPFLLLAGCCYPPVTHMDLVGRTLPMAPPISVEGCPVRQDIAFIPPLLSRQGLWNLMDLDKGGSSVFYPDSIALRLELVQDPCHSRSAVSLLRISFRARSGRGDSLAIPIQPPTPVRESDGHDRMLSLRAEIEVPSIGGTPVDQWGKRIAALLESHKRTDAIDPDGTWDAVRERRRNLIRANLCPNGVRRIVELRVRPEWSRDTLPSVMLDLDSLRFRWERP
jgi:hypothetical protein